VKISKQARRDAKALFRSCCERGLLDEGRVRFTVQQIVSRKPRGYVGILSHFQRLLRLDLERRTARVESAVPLSGAMEAAIRASLAQKYGQGLNVAFSQNAALIGGLRIQAGSDLYDGSVQNRLNSLAESF
jgi:F-type H+-transporting ATPase subunit delta